MLSGIFIVEFLKVDKLNIFNLNLNFCCRYYIWILFMNKIIVLFFDIMNFIRYYIIGSCWIKNKKIYIFEDNFWICFFFVIVLVVISLLVYELYSLLFSKFNI